MCQSFLSQCIFTAIPSYSQGSRGSWLRAEVAQHLFWVSWLPSEGLTDRGISHSSLSLQYGDLTLLRRQYYYCHWCYCCCYCNNQNSATWDTVPIPCGAHRVTGTVHLSVPMMTFNTARRTWRWSQIWICKAKDLPRAPASQWPNQDGKSGLVCHSAGLRHKEVWFQERQEDHVCKVNREAVKIWPQKEAWDRRAEKPRWNPWQRGMDRAVHSISRLESGPSLSSSERSPGASPCPSPLLPIFLCLN